MSTWGLSVLSLILYVLDVNSQIFLETCEVDTITSHLRLKKLTQKANVSLPTAGKWPCWD